MGWALARGLRVTFVETAAVVPTAAVAGNPVSSRPFTLSVLPWLSSKVPPPLSCEPPLPLRRRTVCPVSGSVSASTAVIGRLVAVIGKLVAVIGRLVAVIGRLAVLWFPSSTVIGGVAVAICVAAV